MLRRGGGWARWVASHLQSSHASSSRGMGSSSWLPKSQRVEKRMKRNDERRKSDAWGSGGPVKREPWGRNKEDDGRRPSSPQRSRLVAARSPSLQLPPAPDGAILFYATCNPGMEEALAIELRQMGAVR